MAWPGNSRAPVTPPSAPGRAALGLICGLVCGLAPQFVLHVSLGAIHHLFALLFAACAVFIVSLGLLPLGAAWALRPALPGPDRKASPPGWWRTALVVEAAGLTLLWYRSLNPFPVDLLLSQRQYLPVLLVAAVLLLGWLVFLFLLRKIL